MEYEVICDWCGKEFDREARRANEATKRGWKQYCSSGCLLLAKNKKIKTTCDNPNCQKTFYRPPKEFSKSKRHFCSSRCSAIVNNIQRGLKTRKKCLNDGCEQLVYKFKIFCSNKCFQEHRRKIFLPRYKKRVLATIKKFFKENGRTPFKNEMYPIYKPARIAFGTWNKAVRAAGFVPNQLKFTHKYTANDGHICDSLAEKIIDDWLTARKIKHKINVLYPGERRFTSDFKVGNYWIEFFGLSGQHKRYDELKITKLKIAKKNQLNLIAIYPNDLFPKSRLDQLLNCLPDSGI